MKINKSELLEKLEKIFKSKNHRTNRNQTNNNFVVNNRLNKAFLLKRKNDVNKLNINSNNSKNNGIDVNGIIKRINSKGKNQKNINNKSNRNNNNFNYNNTDVLNINNNNIYKKNITNKLTNLKKQIYNTSCVNIYDNYKTNESFNPCPINDNSNNNNNKSSNNNIYRKTYNNYFTNKNKRLTNSISMKNCFEEENLFNSKNYNQKKENINNNNNMTVTIKEKQNNYIKDKDKAILNNSNYFTMSKNSNYNIQKRKIMRFKCNLAKDFIKYIKKFISLFLKKYKYFFLNKLKKIENEKENKIIFRKTCVNNGFLNNSLCFRNNSNNHKYFTTERSSSDFNIDSNNNNEIFSFEHTYNNFYEPFRKNNILKKKKQLLLNRIDEINNNTNMMYNNYLNNNSNNIEFPTLSEEENSQLLSISISSKEDFNLTNKKNMNNNSVKNRLFLKFKDNKNIDNSFNNMLYSNNVILTNNRSITNNNIYFKKKNFNTGNKINGIMKRRENYLMSNTLNKNKSLGKGLSEEKMINNSSYLYINKRLIYKSAKKMLLNNEKYRLNNNINNRSNNNIKRYTTITKDNKLHISINSINPHINYFKKYKKYIKYENSCLTIDKISFKIINKIFIFDKLKKNVVYKKINNNNMNANGIRDRLNHYHYMNNRSYIKKYDSFLIKSEEKKPRKNEYNIRQSYNSIYQPKIRLKINNQNIFNVNKNKINDCKNIIINFQDNKYLKGCVNFLIKIITKVISLDLFRHLKKYSKYCAFKNLIIKINQKKN